MSVERVPGTDRFPVSIYRPKDVVPDGWYWLGHAAESNQALIVKPALPPKSGRNYAVSTGRSGSGMSSTVSHESLLIIDVRSWCRLHGPAIP